MAEKLKCLLGRTYFVWYTIDSKLLSFVHTFSIIIHTYFVRKDKYLSLILLPLYKSGILHFSRFYFYILTVLFQDEQQEPLYLWPLYAPAWTETLVAMSIFGELPISNRTGGEPHCMYVIYIRALYYRQYCHSLSLWCPGEVWAGRWYFKYLFTKIFVQQMTNY